MRAAEHAEQQAAWPVRKDDLRPEQAERNLPAQVL